MKDENENEGFHWSSEWMIVILIKALLVAFFFLKFPPGG